MPKMFSQPLLVSAPQYADRIIITTYTIDAQNLTGSINAIAGQAGGEGFFPYPTKSLDRPAVERACAHAGRAMLTALGVDASKLSDTDLGRAYYAATREALYREI